MEADFSIDLGPDAPALELPWHDPDGRWRYFPLRGPVPGEGCGGQTAPLDLIPEARDFPALRHFLERANSPQSAWESAKCGVWAEAVHPTENLFGALGEQGFEHGSYVDVVLAAERAALRDSLRAHEQWARQMAAMLEEETACEQSAAEIVVRRCYFHRATKSEEAPEESDAGYCLSIFVFGYGTDPEMALRSWECALNVAADCLLRLHPRAIAR
jgi:hypothetical protein